MKRMLIASVFAALMGWSVESRAADSASSAGAASDGHRSGTATATAQYEGDVGFARTNSESGRVNAARAVAVGVDEDGLSLSISQAFAPRFGPAIATNFNLTIDRDGDVSASRGVAVADGSAQRAVSVGGSGGNGRATTSTATGSTGPHGQVRVHTEAHDHQATPTAVRVVRSGGTDRTVVVRGVRSDEGDVRRVRIIRR